MSEQIKDFIAAVNGPRGCLDGWLEGATESEVRDAIKAVMRGPSEQSLQTMTLRDYFAIKATDRDVEEFMHLQGNGAKMQVRGRIAARWAFADAMLAAREVKA